MPHLWININLCFLFACINYDCVNIWYHSYGSKLYFLCYIFFFEKLFISSVNKQDFDSDTSGLFQTKTSFESFTYSLPMFLWQMTRDGQVIQSGLDEKTTEVNEDRTDERLSLIHI